jgi:hypothetical protein
MEEAQSGGMGRVIRIVIIVVVLIVIVNIIVNVALKMRGSGGDDAAELSGDELHAARGRIEAAPLPDFAKRRIQDAISKAERQRASE